MHDVIRKHFQLIANTNPQNFMKQVTSKIEIVPIIEFGRSLLTIFSKKEVKNSKMSMLKYVELKHLKDKLQ